MLQKKTNSYDELSTYSLVFHCCLNLDKIVERNKKMGSTSLGFFRTKCQNIGWYPTTEWFQIDTARHFQSCLSVHRMYRDPWSGPLQTCSHRDRHLLLVPALLKPPKCSNLFIMLPIHLWVSGWLAIEWNAFLLTNCFLRDAECYVELAWKVTQ